jgi:cell division protein FtsI/penicillin-binding protein 2
VPGQAHFDADLPDIGYGQGRMLASPLEMCRLSATAANGGATMQPRFVTKIDTYFEDPRPATDKLRKPRIIDRPPVVLAQGMPTPDAKAICEYMRGVVTSGTARGVFDGLPFAVAGKTGTAQNRQYDRQPHSWFTGFAPYNPNATPRYAFACVVENGGYGKTVAAMICRQALNKIASKPNAP